MSEPDCAGTMQQPQIGEADSRGIAEAQPDGLCEAGAFFGLRPSAASCASDLRRLPIFRDRRDDRVFPAGSVATGSVGSVAVTGSVGPVAVTGFVGPVAVTGFVGPVGVTGLVGWLAATGSAGSVTGTPAFGAGVAAAGDQDPARALVRLKKALRRERARGRAGHWTYDLARHLSLAQEVRRAEAAVRAKLFAHRPDGGREVDPPKARPSAVF